jgi:hypothetical protein
MWFDRVERRAGDDGLADRVERRIGLGGNGAAERVLGRLAAVLDGEVDPRSERDAIGKQVRQPGIERVVVGIHHRECDVRFAATDVSQAHRIGDERHLAQHRQRSDLRDIEESLGAASGKEFFVEEIDQVVAPERHGEQLAFLQVHRKQFREVDGGDREDGTVRGGNNRRRVDRADRARAGDQRSAETRFRFDFRRPELPARQLSEIELELRLRGAVVLAAGPRTA